MPLLTKLECQQQTGAFCGILWDTVVPVWFIGLKQLHRTCGTGARANGHEGSHHDGLRTLYDFRTLFHGTSADTKEAGSEVTGVKSYTVKNLASAAPAQPLASAFRFVA
jgi:hypothetical protein